MMDKNDIIDKNTEIYKNKIKIIIDHMDNEKKLKFLYIFITETIANGDDN